MKLKKTRSLRRLIPSLLLWILVPVAILLIIYTKYVVDGLEKSAFEGAERKIHVLSSTMVSKMNFIEHSLVDLSSNDENFHKMSIKLSDNAAYMNAYEVEQYFNSTLSVNQDVSQLILFSSVNDWFSMVDNPSYEMKPEDRIENRKAIEDKITSMLDSSIETSRWFYQEIGKRYFLVRALQYKEVYCLALIDLQRLNSMVHNEYDIKGQMIFIDDKEQVIFGNDWLRMNQILLPEENEDYRISGSPQKHIAIKDNLQYIRVVYIEPYEILFSKMDGFLIIIFFLAVLILLVVPLISVYLWNLVVQPLVSMVVTMEQIRKGDLNRQLDDYQVKEFTQVKNTFNVMVEEIANLKIESYEKEIEKKQLEYQQLQSQVKPHFYLNCLKNLYGMAESGDFKDIQASILHLSQYLRYNFSNIHHLVTLDKEIEACENYVELFNINQQVKAVIDISYDVDIETLYIPPISLLTFVENCFKYSLKSDEMLYINLTAKLLNDKQNRIIAIHVSDNGYGFSEELLPLMNNEEVIIDAKSKRHIGIYNVTRRLKLTYGNNCSIYFYNNDGANVDIFIHDCDATKNLINREVRR